MSKSPAVKQQLKLSLENLNYFLKYMMIDKLIVEMFRTILKTPMFCIFSQSFSNNPLNPNFHYAWLQFQVLIGKTPIFHLSEILISSHVKTALLIVDYKWTKIAFWKDATLCTNYILKTTLYHYTLVLKISHSFTAFTRAPMCYIFSLANNYIF